MSGYSTLAQPLETFLLTRVLATSSLSNSPNFNAIKLTLARILDDFNAWILDHTLFVGIQLAVFTVLFFWFLQTRFPTPKFPTGTATSTAAPAKTNIATSVASMQQPNAQLDPPKDTPISKEELSKYDGTQEGYGIYVAIKGTVFDVSAKRDMYGPGCGYSVFTGKDASRALGKSSLKPEDAVSDYSTLEGDELKTLNDWFTYFEKRYNIVGKVSDA